METLFTRIGNVLSDDGVSIDILTENRSSIALGVVNLGGALEAKIGPALARSVAAALIGAADHCDRQPYVDAESLFFDKIGAMGAEAEPPRTDQSAAARWDGRTLAQRLEETRVSAVTAALAAYSGNKVRAAEALDMTLVMLNRTIQIHGLAAEEQEGDE